MECVQASMASTEQRRSHRVEHYFEWPQDEGHNKKLADIKENCKWITDRIRNINVRDVLIDDKDWWDRVRFIMYRILRYVFVLVYGTESKIRSLFPGPIDTCFCYAVSVQRRIVPSSSKCEYSC